MDNILKKLMSKRKEKKESEMTPKQRKFVEAMKKKKAGKKSLAEQINFGGNYRK